MTTEELKEWMGEKFTGLENRLDKINGSVSNHDKWLNFMRGAIGAILLMLGYVLTVLKW